MQFYCFNRPFPSSKKSRFQSEAKCEAIDMKMIFHSHGNKTHFHINGFALSLVLKKRFFGTRKWPILFSSPHPHLHSLNRLRVISPKSFCPSNLAPYSRMRNIIFEEYLFLLIKLCSHEETLCVTL